MKKLFFLILILSGVTAFSLHKITLRGKKVTINNVTGRSFYVSTEGNNTDGLSDANAWTLSKAITSINNGTVLPGDVVRLKKGNTFSSGLMNITVSGTASNPITITNYGSGELPKLIGSGSTITALFYINNRSYLTFDGLEITDPTLESDIERTVNAKIQRVFYLDGTTHNVKILNCKMTLIGVGAFFVGPGNTMDHCDISNTRMVVNTNDGSQPGADDDYGANPLVIASNNNIITYNHFYDNWATSFDYDYDGGAIEFTRDGSGSTTNGNYIAYNNCHDNLGFMEVTGNSAGNTIIYNKIINNGSLFYFQNSYTYSGWKFYNNVVVENKATRVSESRLIGGSMSAVSLSLINNIFQLSNGVDVASSTTGITHQNNIYKLSSGSVLGYTAGGSELSTSATLFLSTSGDASGWNYRPDAGSPAINFGQTIAGVLYDYGGVAITGTTEAGVYEYIAVVSIGTDPPVIAQARQAFFYYDQANRIINLKANWPDNFYLVNNIGQLMIKGAYKVGKTSISISRFSSGVYFLSTGRGTYAVNRL